MESMVTLTQEQRQLLQQNGGELLRLLDPETNKEYVLVQAEVYQRLQASLSDVEPRELYPLLHRALKDEGWDEPHMDEYNRFG
jgi:hemerythrin-like domain-containing protein